MLCWGANNNGGGSGSRFALGTATLDELSPVEVPPIANVKTIGFGGRHGCFVMNDRSVQCTGENDVAQLGNGAGTPTTRPAPAAIVTAAVDLIATGGKHTCVAYGSTVSCWGCAAYDPVNDCAMAGTTLFTLDVGAPVIQLENRYRHTCALRNDHTLRCFGANQGGQLGNGMTSTTPVTTLVDPGVSGVDDVAIGREHTCVLQSGQVTCWGSNSRGQLGDAGGQRLVPGTPVPGVPPFVEIEAGQQHTCGLTASRELYCWGRNDSGGIGVGAFSSQELPRLVPIPPTLQLAMGSESTCALTNDGIYCWGFNDRGQVGIGSTVNQPAPQLVSVACP